MWRGCWGEAKWEKRNFSFLPLPLMHLYSVASARSALISIRAWLISAQLFFLLLLLPELDSESVILCLHCIFSQLPWRWLWWLRAGVIWPRCRISREQETLCGRPALVQTSRLGHFASALQGNSCKQLLAKILSFTSSFEHPSFVPAMPDVLHIPGRTTAPWGHRRWMEKGWFIREQIGPFHQPLLNLLCSLLGLEALLSS